ncbi:hypothetical protein [uncultured Subdoligranulum sp.]|uniref:hypothetical protein n=1 Tax=uncultured Subdoligranulum sp. TaxID=512298 RepID=UPI00320A5C2C
MSKTRKIYIARLVGRCLLLGVCLWMCFFYRQAFSVLEGMHFFTELSPLHFLWCVWVTDMVLQIIPIRNKVPLGSQKLFANRFRPIREKINYEALKNYIVSTTKAAYKVFILWCVLVAVLGVLYYTGVIDKIALFMISVLFYVCDLICVLVWCPFRLIMKNRCCTTCRIFNWDHLMMFSPLVFIGGFYATSLAAMAGVAWLVWELCVMMYPERFWDHSNVALQCSECTDKLCTQYCQKLRPGRQPER